jgi:hypothetical protein
LVVSPLHQTNHVPTFPGNPVKSPVWVTAMEPADIYIDYGSTGVNLIQRSVGFLESTKLIDSADNDMSGATIFAVKRGDPATGRPVDIAVAWGQNPDNSFSNDGYALDLGTTVPPFSLVKVGKTVDKAIVNPGEEMTYTIR